MGQARQRGNKDERIAQAMARPVDEALIPSSSAGGMLELLAQSSRLNPLFKKLTTPEKLDDQVMQFAHQLSETSPIYLDCEPELWSRQSCCDLNVLKYIESHGGRMLCGYRVWYAQPRYIEGERHAVWTDGATIRDVSFVDTGETRVVFVPDELGFDDAPGKVRFAFNAADKAALVAYERFMGPIPFVKMADKEAWDTFLTYEAWLAGNRMPNVVMEPSRKKGG